MAAHDDASPKLPLYRLTLPDPGDDLGTLQYQAHQLVPNVQDRGAAGTKGNVVKHENCLLSRRVFAVKW